MRVKTGLGQDSHRFASQNQNKPLILGGIKFPEPLSLIGNSDADVVLHALTNAISSITGVNVIGELSDRLCLQQGITNSQVYLQEALGYLPPWQLSHVALSIEAKTPKITPKINEMKHNVAQLLGLASEDIGITATSGEGLTAFGRGEGIQVLCIVTAWHH
ncbi:MAG: 2-C-methyl-D-erythritol 2,4-cyclodiphosphate synthase [Pseudomonadota bacterium]|nr:2-C-methyl-D-erythritol 2,4-cyclodiphosphate synthase [Pseudomonadota bacterium]